MDSPISTNRRRGAVNTGTPYHGIADKPVLSISSGIHDFLLTLSISADEGCEVVFTLDGSDPDRDHVGGRISHSRTSIRGTLATRFANSSFICKRPGHLCIWFTSAIPVSQGFGGPRRRRRLLRQTATVEPSWARTPMVMGMRPKMAARTITAIVPTATVIF